MGAREGTWGHSPKFDRPPVIEVAVGVEFVPAAELGVVELVKLHEAWEGDFPNVVEQPPLPPGPPPEGSVLQGMGLQIRGGLVGPIRLWMLKPDGHLLVQVQHDRLVLNWRKLEGGDYPSYDKLRGLFRARWESFLAHVQRRVAIRPTVAEVTFVNRIEPTASTPDLSGLLSSARPVNVPEFATLAQATAQYVCAVHHSGSDAGGQLVLTAAPHLEGGHMLTVVTRMGLGGESPEIGQIMSALDLAHATSVQGFVGITTEDMHQAWGRTR